MRFEEIINSLPNKSGVYKIVNIANNRFYYGSASDQGIRSRLQQHQRDLRKNKHHSWSLQRDWNELGDDCWSIEVVAICTPSKAKLKEDRLLKKYGVGLANNSYNIKDSVFGPRLPDDMKEHIKQSLRNTDAIWSSNKSGLRGVCWYKRDKKWKASIHRNGKSYHIGYFEDKEKAYSEYLKVFSLSDEDFYKWWDQEKENRKDKKRQRGENGPGSKLTDAQVEEIKALWATGEYSQSELGRQFGVVQSWISHLVRRTNKTRKATFTR